MMKSKSGKAFDQNMDDIYSLLDVYDAVEKLRKEVPLPDDSDTDEERPEVVLRSAVVLLVTYWEAYIEDIATEALDLIVTHCRNPKDLPKELKKSLTRYISDSKNQLEMWNLAGDGWRQLAMVRLAELSVSRNRNFNTPKAVQTRDFLKDCLGIEDVTKGWTLKHKWNAAQQKVDPEGVEKTITPAKSIETLNAIVEMRGEIAHRGRLKQKLDRKSMNSRVHFIRLLVSKTGGIINGHVKKATGGKALF